MRILIHGINFSPELTGIGKYSGEMAEWLAAQGHDVRVVTAPPYYPQWKIQAGFANRWSRSVQSAGAEYVGSLGGRLTVFRCPVWVPARPSGLKRLLHLASFALSSLPVMLSQVFWRPDVVWVVEPPLFCAPQAWLVARLSGAKAWLHIQDYEVDAAFDLGVLKGNALRRSAEFFERLLMRRFDLVSTISLRMLEKLVSKGVCDSQAMLFPNWVRISDMGTAELEVASAYRRELGIDPDDVVALYSGNMGAKQGLEILAEVAALSNEGKMGGLAGANNHCQNSPEVVFVFCGNGAGRERLVESCRKLPNVRFMDLQPAERLAGLLAMADIHLLPQRADAADLVMPSKLTGMLASGRPVVATAQAGTELANVVINCGLVVAPESASEFAAAVLRLASDAGLRMELGGAGREYALLNLDKDRVLGEFEVKLESLTNGSTE